MKLKSKCCKSYKKKGNACKRCPLLAGLTRMAELSKKERRRRLKKAAKRLKKAA